MSASARHVARSVLADVRQRDAWASSLLPEAVDAATLDPRDAALATRLVYGVLSSEGTLDDALARYLKKPGRVHPAVRDVLRIAAYELLFARTPARAAVHEAVAATRAIQPSAAGMSNAVLRRLADDASTFPWGDPETDMSALARAYAHPKWLVEIFIDDMGPERAREMLAASLEPAPLYLAHNPFLTTFDELVAELDAAGAEPQVCELPGCISAGVPRAALRSAAIDRGTCIVSDAAAQIVASLAAPPSGGTGVDVAAGRGTKTLLMQAAVQRSGGTAQIIAADIHSFKIEVLKKRMASLGVPSVECVVADLTDDAAVSTLGGAASADVVLVDAPCSNLGTLRRHPERRWRLTPADIESLATLGERILTVASRLVRPGGFVVYSTCTVTRRENARVIEAFLAGEWGQGFSACSVRDDVPEGWRHWVTSVGWLQTHPTLDGPDGHFAAVLVRS